MTQPDPSPSNRPSSQPYAAKAAAPDTGALYAAFASLETPDDVARFMADLCTPGEIRAFAERWAIARLLHAGGLGYREIAAQTGASTTTVARVARFLHQEPHRGYRIVLDRLPAATSGTGVPS